MGTSVTRPTYEELLDRPIEIELRHALRTGGRNKIPGRDGIALEFYKANWTAIKYDLCIVKNLMYMEKNIAYQETWVIICLRKHSGAQRPIDVHPISLLNVDYKTLALILVQRLRPLNAVQLQETELCGVAGNTILEAATIVWEVIALA